MSSKDGRKSRSHDPTSDPSRDQPNAENKSRGALTDPAWWKIPLITLISSVVVALVSVGATLGYQWWSSQPTLKGRILATSLGAIDVVRGGQRSSHITLSTFVALANAREVPVLPLDFFMHVEVNGKWLKAPIPATQELPEVVELEFPPNSYLGMPSTVSLLIKTSSLLTRSDLGPILRDKPQTGVLIFYLPDGVDKKSIGSLKLEIIDAFGGIHTVDLDKSRTHDPRVMQRLDPQITLIRR